MATILYVYNGARQLIGHLPEVYGLSEQIVFNGVGVLSGSYPRSGVNADLLNLELAYLRVVEDGVNFSDYYVLEDDADDKDDDPNSPYTFTARSTMSMLEWGIVFPPEHSGTSLSVNKKSLTHKFVKRTPGFIVTDLVNRARARGALDDLILSFTATHDSEGNPWPKKYTISYAVGTSYLEIVLGMIENGWIDARTTGFRLDLYVNTTMSMDRPKIVYRTGKDVTTKSRTRSRRTVRNAVLGVGEGTNMVHRFDSTRIAQIGRREMVLQDGRATIDGSLVSMTEKALSGHTGIRDFLSMTVPVGDRGVPGETIWRPNVDYFVGDYIYLDERRVDSDDLRRLAVKTITFTWATADQGPTCVIEFQNTPTSFTLSASARLKKIAGGAIRPRIPTSTKPVAALVAPTIGVDTVNIVPSNTQSLVPAVNKAAVSMTAVQGDTNEDGSDPEDVNRWEFQWRYADTVAVVWAPPRVSDVATFDVVGVEPGRPVIVRARAVIDGDPPQYSTWAETTVPVVVEDDTTPPQAPAAPTLASRLGSVVVTWSGLGADGQPMPADFHHVEVHVGAEAGFATSAATRRGEIPAGATRLTVAGLPYGDVFVRLVAVDSSGNTSAASASTGVTVKALVDTDIIGAVLTGAMFSEKSINTEALADGSVDASKLLDDAVVAGKIAAEAVAARELAANSVVAGKIAADAVTADTIAANAVTADKIEANAITADKIEAGALIGKMYASALEGARWEIIGGEDARTIFAYSGLPLESAPGGISSMRAVPLPAGYDGYIGAINIQAPEHVDYQGEAPRLSLISGGAIFNPGEGAGGGLNPRIEAESHEFHGDFNRSLLMWARDFTTGVVYGGLGLRKQLASESDTGAVRGLVDLYAAGKLTISGGSNSPSTIVMDEQNFDLTGGFTSTGTGVALRIRTTQGAGLTASGDTATLHGGVNASDAKVTAGTIGAQMESGGQYLRVQNDGNLRYSGAVAYLQAAHVLIGAVASNLQRYFSIARLNDQAGGDGAAYEARTYLSSATKSSWVTRLLRAGAEVARLELGEDRLLSTVGIIASPMRSVEYLYSDASVGSTTSSAGAAMGARGGAGTFVAPPSGVVKIDYGGQTRASADGNYAGIGIEVRAGENVGSGSVVRAYSVNDAVLNYFGQWQFGMTTTVLTGLTPGATYNCRSIVSSSSGTAQFVRGRFVIVPQP